MAVGDDQKRKIAATLIGIGIAKKDAAKTVGVTPATISNWCRDDRFQAACDKAAEDVIANVIEAGQAATSLALAKVIELIGYKDRRVALNAAQDVLDRFGLPKGMKHEHAGDPNKPIKIDFSGLPDDLLNRLEEELEDMEGPPSPD